MVVLLDPTMLMSRRTAHWVGRYSDQGLGSVAMVEALAGTSGLNGVDAALGMFAGSGVWAYRRSVQCAVPIHHVRDNQRASELFTAGRTQAAAVRRRSSHVTVPSPL